MTYTGGRRSRGFTIVELLIVIIVIAILATISTIAYGGMQARARDAQREQDVKVIAKALEMYYIDNGEFPPGSGALFPMPMHWSVTSIESSWNSLASYLVPDYISELPKDPLGTGYNPMGSGTYQYGYFRDMDGTYCAADKQTYILVYNYESKPKKDTLIGNCDTVSRSSLGPYASSNYRVVKS